MIRRIKKDSLLTFVLYTLLVAVVYSPVPFSGKSLQPPLYQPYGVVEGWSYGYEGRLPAGTFNIDLATPAYYEWPINKLVGDIYSGGGLPLWNPYQGAGTPLATQYSSRVFFPYQIIENISPVRTWDFFMLARLIFAGFFTYLFLRSIGLGFAAALFGGVFYMFSGSFTWFINLEQFVNNAMMVPVLLYALEKLVRVKSGKRMALSGITIALVILAGQPEIGLYIMLLGACYYFFRCLCLFDTARLAGAASGFLVASVLGLALAAPLIIPFAELTRNAHHIHPAGGDMGVRSSVAAEKALGLFTPSALELPMEPGEIAHSWDSPEGPVYFRFFPHNGDWDWLGGYTGLLPVFFIVTGLFLLLSRKESRWKWQFFFFVSFGLLVTLKNFGIKPFLFLGYLPLFDQVWSQRWAGPSWTFSVAAAAAIAVQIFAGYCSGDEAYGPEDAADRSSPWPKITGAYRAVSSRTYISRPLTYALTMWLSGALAYNTYKEWMRAVTGDRLMPAEKALIKGSFPWAILILVGLYLLVTLIENRRVKSLGLRRYAVVIASHAILINLLFLSENRSVVIVQNLVVLYLVLLPLIFYGARKVLVDGGRVLHILRSSIDALGRKPLLAGTVSVLAAYLYFAFIAFEKYFGSGPAGNVRPYFFPSMVAGTLVTLTLLLFSSYALWRYIRRREGLPAIFALVILELWWAVPRGYNHHDLLFKFIPLAAGLAVAAALILNRRGAAMAGAVIFLLLSVWVDGRAANGFPDRHDPFTEAPYVGIIKDRNDYDRVMGGYGVLHPNFASALGMWDVRYINALSIETFQDFRSRHLHIDPVKGDASSSLWFTGGREYYLDTPPSSGYMLVSRPIEDDLLANLKSYSFLGVRYIVLPKDSDINDYTERADFRLIYDDEVRIFENDDALPRVFMACGIVYAEGYKEAQAALSSPDFDPAATVVLEKKAPAGYENLECANSVSEVFIDEYDNNRVVIRARNEGPGILVLTDTHYPGWKAYVDGKAVEIYRVNGLVRGVFLDRGEHTVVFRYLPTSFLLGCALSALSLAASVALVAGGREKRTD